MAKPGKVSMPQSTGGLMRYFDEESSNIKIKPTYVIIFAIIIIIIELVLHMQGSAIFG